MRIVILRNIKNATLHDTDGRYLQRLDTNFAERVIGNLRSPPNFCDACGPDCTSCREPYNRRLGKDVAAVIDLPSVLPYIIEAPQTYVPGDIPRHDVLLAINVHEQVLIEILNKCDDWGTKGVVVPIEASNWMSAATRSEARRICREKGVEISFPKPFCSFKPPQGGILARFREYFHIGYPDVSLTVKNGKITETHVNVSAACGATYCVARWLAGRRLDDNLEIEVISRRWHSFPCTAGMERDPELDDDTPLHVAGRAHYAILARFREIDSGKSNLVVSPVGKMVQRPIPPKENLENIQKAKILILKRLTNQNIVTLAQIKKEPGVSPAAVNSALLMLKKDGKIKIERTRIILPGTNAERCIQ